MISLLNASTCFEHCCAHHQEVKIVYRASGIIKPVGGRPVHRTGWQSVVLRACLLVRSTGSVLNVISDQCNGTLAMSWISKGKGKAVPLRASSGPEGSGKFRFPDFVTTAQDGGKVVSLTHRPPLPPRNTSVTHKKYSWYSFLLEAEST